MCLLIWSVVVMVGCSEGPSRDFIDYAVVIYDLDQARADALAQRNFNHAYYGEFSPVGLTTHPAAFFRFFAGMPGPRTSPARIYTGDAVVELRLLTELTGVGIPLGAGRSPHEYELQRLSHGVSHWNAKCCGRYAAIHRYPATGSIHDTDVEPGTSSSQWYVVEIADASSQLAGALDQLVEAMMTYRSRAR